MGFGSPNAGEKLEHFVGLFVDLTLFRSFRVFLQVVAFYAEMDICMQNILRLNTYYRKRRRNTLPLNGTSVKGKHENVIIVSISLPPFDKHPYSGGVGEGGGVIHLYPQYCKMRDNMVPPLEEEP